MFEGFVDERIDPDHAPYSKHVMAADTLVPMRRLGHKRFAVVGHDRGSYVALRLALDHGGHSIDSGHHMAEEAPDGLARALLPFLTQSRPDTD